MSHSPRFAPQIRPVRRVGLVGAMLLTVFVLTGCFAVELKTTIHADNTMSGTAKIGVSKSLASLAGGPDSLLADLKKDDPCNFGSKKGVSKDYDDGTFVGVECTFSNVSFADFNEGNDGPQISRDGDTFRLTGSFDAKQTLSQNASSSPSSQATSLPSGFPTDLSSLLPSGFPTDLSSLLPSGFPTSLLPSSIPSLPTSLPSGFPTDFAGLDPAAMLKTAKINFEFTFPGKVKSSKGQVKGNTVTFKPDNAGKIDFETVADVKSSTVAGVSKSVWICLGALLVLLAGLVLFLLRRRGKRGQTPAFAGGYPAPGFDQGYTQPQYPGQPQYTGQPQYPGQPDYPAEPQYPVQPQYPAQYPEQQPPQGQGYNPPPA